MAEELYKQSQSQGQPAAEEGETAGVGAANGSAEGEVIEAEFKEEK